MKVFIQFDNNRVRLRSPYHVKIKDLFFSFEGYTYDPDQQVHSFPMEAKEKLMQRILALNVSIVEVKELGVIPPLPKVATYKINNDTIEVLASFSTQVFTTTFFNNFWDLLFGFIFICCLGS